DGPAERCGLDELRPRTNHSEDLPGHQEYLPTSGTRARWLRIQPRMRSRLVRVHAMVRRRPSSCVTPATKPSFSLALVGSPKRWPERSQSLAGVRAIGVAFPVMVLIRFASSRMLVSAPEARL